MGNFKGLPVFVRHKSREAEEGIAKPEGQQERKQAPLQTAALLLLGFSFSLNTTPLARGGKPSKFLTHSCHYAGQVQSSQGSKYRMKGE